jgi:hypothetical protein
MKIADDMHRRRPTGVIRHLRDVARPGVRRHRISLNFKDFDRASGALENPRRRRLYPSTGGKIIEKIRKCSIFQSRDNLMNIR